MPNPFFIQINKQFFFKQFSIGISTQFNCQKHFYFKLFSLVKTVLIQTIQFSISIVFVYTQLNVKTVLFQTIQFSISLVSMLKTVPFKTI